MESFPIQTISAIPRMCSIIYGHMMAIIRIISITSINRSQQTQSVSEFRINILLCYNFFICFIITSGGNKPHKKYHSRNMTEIIIFRNFRHIQSNRHEFYKLKRAENITPLVIHITQLKTHFMSIIYWAANRKSVICRDFDSFKIH